MTDVDLRVKVLGRLIALQSISTMHDARIRTMQSRQPGHNRVTDLLFGAVARGARLTDGTVAGETGPLAVRVYRRERPTDGSRPLVVHFLGGGWVLGGLYRRRRCRSWWRSSGPSWVRNGDEFGAPVPSYL